MAKRLSHGYVYYNDLEICPNCGADLNRNYTSCPNCNINLVGYNKTRNAKSTIFTNEYIREEQKIELQKAKDARSDKVWQYSKTIHRNAVIKTLAIIITIVACFLLYVYIWFHLNPVVY